MDEKLKVARLAIISNAALTGVKLYAGILMGSMAVISDSIHSGMDLLASIIAYLSVRESGKPADDIHRYGHGKFENLAAITEALLIVVAAGVIIWQAVPRLFGPTEVHALGLGAAVMAISMTIHYYVSSRLFDVARRTDSPALEADGWHLRTDVYTSMGVFVGIIAIKITGLTILDPIIALLVTLLILKAAYKLLRESLANILDARLPDEDEKAIRELIEKHSKEYVYYYKLRTRKSGPFKYADLHLVVPRQSPISGVHNLCQRIEQTLQESITAVDVFIKTEPCSPDQGDCHKCTLQIKYPARVKDLSANKCIDCLQCQQADDEKKI